MKSIWTVGKVQWTHMGKPHPVILWSLWASTLAVLCLWLVGLVLGFGRWIHILGVGALVLGVLCTALIFSNGEFLERPLVKRLRRIRKSGTT